MEIGYPILSTLIFMPVAVGLMMLLIKREHETLIKLSALAGSVFTFIFSLPLFRDFDKTKAGMQYMEKHSWIPAWDVNYLVGVDGISVLMILLSTLTSILCVLISWNSVKIKVKEFFIALMLIEGSMIGVFCALDMFLFYIFWEAMLIPMYLIVGVWGGPNRIYAAVKFFLYTLVGSLLMLVGIIVLYVNTGTFSVPEMMGHTLSFKMQMMLFWAFFAAFSVKVPMFPLHTWLPDAHTEAPAAGSVILAAILIKMGAYGFLRFSIPLFPAAAVAMMPAMMTLSVIAIIYGGLICLVQTDLKRLIAYSSVSHMGFVTLGIFSLNAQGMSGAILQMVNHGIVTGAMFLCIGIIYERTHTREIKDYGGVARTFPLFASFFMVFTLASIGLPGTNGFVGEFLILLGGFKAKQWAGVLAATGIIIGAVYMLRLYQQVFFLETGEKVKLLEAMTLREIFTLLPFLILVFWIGCYPNAFLSFMDAGVAGLIERVNLRSKEEADLLIGALDAWR